MRALGEGVAQSLSSSRHNVKYGPDVGLGGHADEDVFGFGWRERRVILTHDRGFLNDTRFPFTRNPGVIVLPGGAGNTRVLLRTLSTAIGLFSTHANIWDNAKIAIDCEDVWTVRWYNRRYGRVENETLKFAGGEVYSLEQ